MNETTTALPPEVEAALAAYLAARVDDVTWRQYINSLGPGLALDLATYLCQWTEADADAREQVAFLYVRDPEEDEEDGPPGLSPCSSSLDVLALELHGLKVTLAMPRLAATDTTYWRATVSGVDGGWKAEAGVTFEEVEHWPGFGHTCLSPCAVAVCRALCLAWCPEWARAQAAEARNGR
jgi:hypothetical protein